MNFCIFNEFLFIFWVVPHFFEDAVWTWYKNTMDIGICRSCRDTVGASFIYRINSSTDNHLYSSYLKNIIIFKIDIFSNVFISISKSVRLLTPGLGSPTLSSTYLRVHSHCLLVKRHIYFKWNVFYSNSNW